MVMKRVRRKGKFSISCDKRGEGKEYNFLIVRYGKNYIGQLMIKNPILTIPEIIKTLETTLKNEKALKALNKGVSKN